MHSLKFGAQDRSVSPIPKAECATIKAFPLLLIELLCELHFLRGLFERLEVFYRGNNHQLEILSSVIKLSYNLFLRRKTAKKRVGM